MIKTWKERCNNNPTIAAQIWAMEEEIEELRTTLRNTLYVPKTKNEQLAYEAGLYQGMVKFAQDLNDNPAKAKEFFGKAGILDDAGNLTEFYKGENKK